jgi:hypothetical protein
MIQLCLPGQEAGLLGIPEPPRPPDPPVPEPIRIRVTRYVDRSLLTRPCAAFVQLLAMADAAGLLPGVKRTPIGTPIDDPPGILRQTAHDQIWAACNNDPLCCEQLVPPEWQSSYELHTGIAFGTLFSR